MGGIYGVAIQRGTKRRLKPKGSGRVRKNLINTWQITGSQVRRAFRNSSHCSARNYVDRGGLLVSYIKRVVILRLVRRQSAEVRANGSDGIRGSTLPM